MGMTTPYHGWNDDAEGDPIPPSPRCPLAAGDLGQYCDMQNKITSLQTQLATKDAQLAAQAAVLDAHDEWAHDITRIGLEANAVLSEVFEIVDKLKSRKPT